MKLQYMSKIYGVHLVCVNHEGQEELKDLDGS